MKLSPHRTVADADDEQVSKSSDSRDARTLDVFAAAAKTHRHQCLASEPIADQKPDTWTQQKQVFAPTA
jgi:hypothetical protein